MKTNAAGVALIKKSEALRLRAYLCAAGVPTIGYGHTGGVTHEDVQRGRTITEPEADELLAADLEKFERGVEHALGDVAVSANQFSALVSFAFNCGLQALGNSTLLRLLHARDFPRAAGEFAKWTRAAGVVLPGLVVRRAAERTLFLTP